MLGYYVSLFLGMVIFTLACSIIVFVASQILRTTRRSRTGVHIRNSRIGGNLNIRSSNVDLGNIRTKGSVNITGSDIKARNVNMQNVSLRGTKGKFKGGSLAGVKSWGGSLDIDTESEADDVERFDQLMRDKGIRS